MRRLSCLALGVTLAYSSSGFAAGTPPSSANIFQAIQQLQQMEIQEAAVLQGFQQSLTSIQTALQGLAPTTSNVLHTPLALLQTPSTL